MVESPDGDACTVNNSVYTGYCGMITDGDVAMAGFVTDITWWGHQFFDPTSVYFQAGNILISAKPPLTPQWNSVFKAFKPKVLILILISLVAVILTLWLIQVNSLMGKSFSDIIFMTLAILSLESTAVRGLTSCEKILVSIWMVSCFFVISGVFGEITSATATPGFSRKPIDTLEDMVTNNMAWICDPLLRVDDFLREKFPQLISKSKLLRVAQGLGFILDHPLEYLYYFPKEGVSPLIRMYYWDGHGQNPFHFSSPVGDTPIYVTVIVGKGSPWRQAVTLALLHTHSSGILLYKFVPDSTEALAKFGKIQPRQSKEVMKFFTMDKMIPSGIILLVGTVISCLFFIAENVYARTVRKTF